jgi:type I restriction enzyme S subunit
LTKDSHDLVRLNDVSHIIRGVSFNGGEAIASAEVGYAPILRAGNIGETLETDQDLVWVPSGRVSEHQRLQVGDIVMCTSSGSPAVVGKSAQLESEFAGSAGAFCAIVRARPKVDHKYLAYWLKSAQFFRWRDSQAKGANIQNLRVSQLAIAQMPLPRLSEQRRIAAVLAKADRIRRLRRTAAELADSFLGSVFTHMFAARVDFRRQTLGELLLGSPKNGLYLPASQYGRGTAIIRIGNFYGGVLGRPEDFRRVQASPEEVEQFAVQNGEVLVNRVNSLEYLGKCALVEGLVEPTVFESNMMRLRVRREDILPEYMVACLTSTGAADQIRKRARKAVNQASINQQDVKSLMIPVPPMPLQEYYARAVTACKRLLSQQRQAERQAEQLFQSLLHQAFRGEL